MKTANRFLVLIAVVLLSSTSCKDSKEHIVTLNVDTSLIEKSNINDYCDFGQNKDSISNEDYTIIVNVGDKITWQGISTSSEYDTVKIKKIKHVKGEGRNVFDKDSLSGNEKVIGRVLHYTKKDKPYKYKIFFTVYNNGVRRNGTFHIDPKIQVNQ